MTKTNGTVWGDEWDAEKADFRVRHRRYSGQGIYRLQFDGRGIAVVKIGNWLWAKLLQTYSYIDRSNDVSHCFSSRYEVLLMTYSSSRQMTNITLTTTAAASMWKKDTSCCARVRAAWVCVYRVHISWPSQPLPVRLGCKISSQIVFRTNFRIALIRLSPRFDGAEIAHRNSLGIIACSVDMVHVCDDEFMRWSRTPELRVDAMLFEILWGSTEASISTRLRLGNRLMYRRDRDRWDMRKRQGSFSWFIVTRSSHCR